MADFQVRAVSKYILGSPIKMRRVVNSIRGMRAQDALEVLALLPQTAAVPVYTFTSDDDTGIFRAAADELGFTVAGTEAGRFSDVGDLELANNCVIEGTIFLNTAQTLMIAHGSGDPEGSLAADVGSTFHRTDGSTGTSYYVKESGTGNTGWVAK